MKCARCGGHHPTVAGSALCPACLMGGLRGRVVDESWVSERFPQLDDAALVDAPEDEAAACHEGFCFAARDCSSGERVLLRIFQAPDAGVPADRILAELEKRAHLDHPRIARVRDFGRIDGRWYAIEARPEGQPLHRLIETAELSRGNVLDLLPAINEAVEFAAIQGVSLAGGPPNIWVGSDGAATLAGILPLGIPAGAEGGARALEEHPAVGTRIGRYVLLEQIGEGGFAEVYRARQERPVRRDVALKILKLGMDTREVLARFARERQALARMDHNGIARIFDAGATSAGRPFIVMELVDGEPVTTYCDSRALSLRERARLLATVCRAVDHGHAKGVVHRDLKPSNVMVSEEDGKPMPKVIDYGIARAAEAPLSAHSFFTLTRQFVGSPSYMSPEQVAGPGEIDGRSDVYSLGCVLYELLTGMPPLRELELAEMGIKEVVDFVSGMQPEHPADRVSQLSPEEQRQLAAARATDPGGLLRALGGRGLSDVAVKALSNDPAGRYSGATALADDLEAYAENGRVAAPRRKRGAVRRAIKVAGGAAALGVAAIAVSLLDLPGLVATTSADPPAEEPVPEYLKRKPAVSRAADGAIRPVALFQFDGDLGSAIPGGPDMLSWGDPELSFETAEIRGGEAAVLHFPRFLPSQWLKIPNVIGINGPPDATETNRWTLVMDIMFPSLTGPVALFQCHSENFGTAELYAGRRGIGSRFGLFYGSFRPGEWFRIALVSSDNGRAQLYTNYVNGTRWGIPWVKGFHSAGYAFEDELLLLCDGDGVTAEGFLGSVALYDVPLTDEEIRTLGAPSPEGIPEEFVPGAAPDPAGGLPAKSRIAPDDGRPGDVFGHAVATTGDEAWVGAPWADDAGDGAGVVHRYRLEPATGRWAPAGRVPLPPDPKPNSWFGTSLAIEDTLAVAGAPNFAGTGAVYRYRREGGADGVWGDPLPLRADAEVGALVSSFGQSVAILGSGAVVVGSPGANGGEGVVFVFDAETGEQRAVLAAADPQPGRQFGAAVATAGDTLAISAPGGKEVAPGAIEVFARVENDGGVGRLVRSAVILPPAGTADASLGNGLALSADARWLAATAEAGVVVLYEWSADGGWRHHGELPVQVAGSVDPAIDPALRHTVAFSGSGRLLVGSIEGLWDGVRTGTVSVFDHVAGTASGDGDGEWILRRTIAPAHGSQDGRFGGAIACAGGRAWIGAPYDHTDHMAGGAAYPVVLPRFEDQRFATLAPSFVTGSDVAIAGAVAAVGSPGMDSRAYGGQLQILERADDDGPWRLAFRTPDEELTGLPQGSFARVAVGGGRVVGIPFATGHHVVMKRHDGGWAAGSPLALRERPLEVATDGRFAIFVSHPQGAEIAELPAAGGREPVQLGPPTKRWEPRAAIFGGTALLRGPPDPHITGLRWNGVGWDEAFVLPPPEALPHGARFGNGLDLDDRRAIVGSPGFNGATETGFGGLASVHDLADPSAAPAILPCPEGEPDTRSAHGWAVAIRGDVALVSNPYVRRGLAPGRVYLYRRDPDTGAWRHAETLQAGNAVAGDEFGVSLGLDDGWAIVGAKSSWVYLFRIREP